MYDEYQRYIEELQLTQSVHLIGYLNEEHKHAFYSVADIAVIPSSYEPFGIVALESLVFEIPTIVSNTGGLKGIIANRKTGLYMEPNSVESLVESIEFILSNPSEGKTIGENGRKIVNQLFGWNRIAEETARVFDETVVNNKVKESIIK